MLCHTIASTIIGQIHANWIAPALIDTHKCVMNYINNVYRYAVVQTRPVYWANQRSVIISERHGSPVIINDKSICFASDP